MAIIRRSFLLLLLLGPGVAAAACPEDLNATAELVTHLRSQRQQLEIELATAREYAKRVEAELIKVRTPAKPAVAPEEKK